MSFSLNTGCPATTPEAVPSSEKASSSKSFISRLIGVIQWQVRDVRSGGAKVLLFNKLPILIGLFPAFLIIILVRLLRPFILVRFGPMLSSKIGQFASYTDVYICERDAGMHGSRTLDIFYHIYMYHSAKVKKPAANYQLKKMWERVLHIYGFAALLGWVNNRVPGAHDHTIPMQRRPRGDRDIYGMTDGAPPHVSFTAEEERFGQAELVRLGIPKGTPFVCFNARDSAYLEQAFPDQDWSYHRFRNSSINDYLLAADELTRRGYYAIRMGYLVNETLETDNPMIMDYATKYRTDFLDIYLSAKCRFFLSTGTGIDCVPLLFRKPVAMVNFAALETVDAWSVNHVFITKKQWWRKEQRLLTFREIIDSKIGLVEDIYEYERHGIDLIESTPEEISAVAIEMDKRIAGTWQATPEDEELQRRFWSLFKPSEMNQVFRAHYGAEFLRQNQQLLV